MTKQIYNNASIACANEAAVTDYRKYMADKTQRNKRFLLFFVEQKVSRGKLSFFAYVISGERSANLPKQLRNDAFHVKTSQSTKNQLDPAKNENRPIFDICPFCTKPLGLRQSAKNQLDPAKNENRPIFDIHLFCAKPFNFGRLTCFDMKSIVP